MNIGIMGAGAVGCYYGALLARAGHSVTLVGRQPLVTQVTVTGLRFERAGLIDVVQLQASTDCAALSSCELIIFSVKSSDTETAGRDLAPYLNSNAHLLSFQNGVDNADRLEAILGRHVSPVAVYVAAEIVAPGHVKHNGRGDIVMGRSEKTGTLAELFRGAGIQTIIVDDVREALWAKLVLNCAYNALSAVAHTPYGRMIAVGGVKELMTDLALECVAVGQASGVSIPDPDIGMIFGLASSMPDQYSSTAQDLARRRRTEIDSLNGHIAVLGRKLGIPTPANSAMWTVIKLLEANLDRSANT